MLVDLGYGALTLGFAAAVLGNAPHIIEPARDLHDVPP